MMNSQSRVNDIFLGESRNQKSQITRVDPMRNLAEEYVREREVLLDCFLHSFDARLVVASSRAEVMHAASPQFAELQDQHEYAQERTLHGVNA